jgi:DNA invertase Pin-like site-specific DNA recombinase
MPAVVRVARYLRVSRSDQNPELQADETDEFIARRGWELTATFTDQGVSGSRDRRPELDRLLADARRRKFDLLVVYRSDRLFRSLKHMVVTLDELAALGIGFVSVTEPFDTTTPSGRLLLHLVSAMAEFEKAILVERTKAGLAAARRRGARIGRPRARLDLDRARELRAGGRSLRDTAKELGVGAATLQRALSAANA